MSTLTVTNIKATGETNSRAVSGVAASWVNHNAGTAINDSINVSSLTDNSTGYHKHSFTSNHANKNYAASGSVIGDSSTQVSTQTYSFVGGSYDPASSIHTVSEIQYSIMHHSGGINDHQMVQVVTHGDLA